VTTLSSSPDTPGTFQDLLDEVRRDEVLLEHLPDAEPDDTAPPDLTEVPTPGTLPPVSSATVGLIIAFEVSSRVAYDARYRRPIWPRGRSGVTIGIGYDVGYVIPSVLDRDWFPRLPAAALAALAKACGVHGEPAAALVPGLQHIVIPYADAYAVFLDASLPVYTRATIRALPNAALLHPDSLGALVSLVYNRGASFDREGDRYAEMRAIGAAVAERRFADVPAQIRSMKRIWADEPYSAGLLKRRELEARLFEQGLAQH